MIVKSGAGSDPFTVVVSAGTYHLPFDRLVDWLQPWFAANPDVRIVMQHGTTKQFPGAENHEMLTPSGLLSLYQSADVIVLQGGAGGIMDARHADRIPVVVPRVPGGGEVVDEHQIKFGRQVAEIGLAHLAESQQALTELLDRARAGQLPTRADAAATTPGVENTISVLEQMQPKTLVEERVRRFARSARGILVRR